MRAIGQIVRERREALGLTLAALAEEVGSTKSYLSMIENHRVTNPPSTQLLTGLEQALHITGGELQRAADWEKTPVHVRQQLEHFADTTRQAQDLLHWLKDATGKRKEGGRSLDALHRSGQLSRRINRFLKESGVEDGQSSGDSSDAPTDDSVTTSEKSSSVDAHIPIRYQVPVINRVAAGYPTDFTDHDYPRRIADEYIAAPDVVDPDAFAARVVGESMEPNYREGDIVVFSPEAAFESGCDYFVRLEPDHESTFKRVFIEGEGGSETIVLQPLNAKFPPRVVKRENVSGMYRAVWRMSPL